MGRAREAPSAVAPGAAALARRFRHDLVDALPEHGLRRPLLLERQRAFRASLATIGAVSDDALTLSLTGPQARHVLDAAQFKKGSGPIGAAVGGLIMLARAGNPDAAKAALEKLEHEVAQKSPTLELTFSLMDLAPAFLQSPAPDQKHLQKLIADAATFIQRSARLRVPGY